MIVFSFNLQKYPSTDLEDVLFNVFDFDRYNPEIVETLGKILYRHGFDSNNVLTKEYLAIKRAKEYLQVTKQRHSGYVYTVLHRQSFEDT